MALRDRYPGGLWLHGSHATGKWLLNNFMVLSYRLTRHGAATEGPPKKAGFNELTRKHFTDDHRRDRGL